MSNSGQHFRNGVSCLLRQLVKQRKFQSHYWNDYINSVFAIGDEKSKTAKAKKEVKEKETKEVKEVTKEPKEIKDKAPLGT